MLHCPEVLVSNLSSDHDSSADDQQAPCEDTSDVVRDRNDRVALPNEDFSHDASPSVDDTARVEPAAQSASPGASANGLWRSTCQRRPADRYGLVPYH